MTSKDFNYNTLGKTGLQVTEVGIGGYKLDIRSPLNREALKKALISGINLIDTSSTYTNGNSEELIGDVVNELVSSNMLEREDVVIVTKSEEVTHDALEEQITESLERLQIESIDVYLLQNPDTSKVKKAFEYLETEVKRGRIKYFGISSDKFPDAAIELADKFEHFGVIEFPMNFAEPEAYSKLELAENKNLGVLTCRPLSVVFEDKQTLLAEPIVHSAPSVEQITNELDVIHKLEKTLAKDFNNCPTIAEELKNSWLDAQNISNWQTILNQIFLPKLREFNNIIKTTSFKDEELEMTSQSYTYKTARLFNLIISYYKNEHLKLTSKIKENLVNAIPEFTPEMKLSNMSIRALRSTKGISSVLVGIPQLPYVKSVVSELKVPVNKDFNWEKIDFKNLF